MRTRLEIRASLLFSLPYSRPCGLRTHGTREGRAEYEDRARDVWAGFQDPEWAWPFVGADDAYLNHVTSSEILRTVGISDLDIPGPNLDRLWTLISGAWLEALHINSLTPLDR